MRLAARVPVISGWFFRLAVAAALVGLNVFSVLFTESNRSGIAVWLASTFLNTRHGSDLASVGPGSWVGFFLKEWMVAPLPLSLLFLAVSLVLAARSVSQIAAKGRDPQARRVASMPLMLMLGGTALNLAIFASVHRLWGFYLFTGSVLFLTGLCALLQHLVPGTDATQELPPRDRWRYIQFAGIAVVSVITFFWWVPHSCLKLQGLSCRTKGQAYQVELASYRVIKEFIAGCAQGNGKTISVLFDPALFIPASEPGYRITEFWGDPSWNTGADVMVIGLPYTPRRQPVPSDSPGYAAYLRECRLYEDNVAHAMSSPAPRKRYRRCLELPNGGEILIAAGI